MIEVKINELYIMCIFAFFYNVDFGFWRLYNPLHNHCLLRWHREGYNSTNVTAYNSKENKFRPTETCVAESIASPYGRPIIREGLHENVNMMKYLTQKTSKRPNIRRLGD